MGPYFKETPELLSMIIDKGDNLLRLAIVKFEVLPSCFLYFKI
jgi:hypothetical protein